MFELEQAISQWRRQLGADLSKSQNVLDELEDHLRNEVARQVQAGLSLQQAFETAVERIGHANLLRPQFEKASTTRRTPLPVLFGLAASLVIAIAALCYFIVLPLVARANAQYAAWLGFQAPHMNFRFVFRLVLEMCLALAIPAGSLALVWKGILSSRKLARLRPYVIVTNLIFGALLTTPEVVTQVLMFVPLQLLFEASLLIARVWERRTRKYA